ncbi:MAG: hypothetical protein V7K50_27435 [Nostoc sp.]|uniref:hypothetical protein n=1 Tax=Nostoc sp. TaxID=1180 RepID=UPI002FFA822D
MVNDGAFVLGCDCRAIALFSKGNALAGLECHCRLLKSHRQFPKFARGVIEERSLDAKVKKCAIRYLMVFSPFETPVQQ